MSADLVLLALLCALFVIPQVLVRWKVPAPITAVALGLVAVVAGFPAGDATVQMMATYGISALFLLAGLEVDPQEMRKGAPVLAAYLALMAALLALAAWFFAAVLELPLRTGVLAALALLSPSAGFILHSLRSFGLSAQGEHWTRSKAIGAELLALGVMFAALQSTSPWRFLLSSLALAAVVAVVPALMRLFATRVAPFAPRSEFAFLLMLAVVCAYATRKLGVHYLVGAFTVGVAARLFREHLPAMSSERIFSAVEAFASVFVPFYFFKAGLGIRVSDFSPVALLAGAAFLVGFLPLRAGLVYVLQRAWVGEPPEGARHVAVALLPTFVFSLVLAEILRDDFKSPPWLFGGIILYALVNTALPGLLIRGAVVETDPAADAPSPTLSATLPASAVAHVQTTTAGPQAAGPVTEARKAE